MSRLPSRACQRSKTLRISSSARTSQASKKVEPIDAASGRTRLLISDAIELNPTEAPWSYSALAMPQAIEWSLATPKTSAFLPARMPVCSQSSAGLVRRWATLGLWMAVGTATTVARDPAGAGPESVADSCAAALPAGRLVSFMCSVGPPLSAVPGSGSVCGDPGGRGRVGRAGLPAPTLRLVKTPPALDRYAARRGGRSGLSPHLESDVRRRALGPDSDGTSEDHAQHIGELSDARNLRQQLPDRQDLVWRERLT